MDPKIEQLVREALVPLAGEIVESSIADVRSIRFDKQHGQQLAAVCVYATILELGRAAMSLLETGNSVAFSPLLRSIFESCADLRAILVNGDYPKRMGATLLTEKLRLLRILQRAGPERVGLDDELASIDVPADQQKIMNAIAEFEAQGIEPLNNAARLRASDLEPAYEVLYWWLCLEGHNNLTAIEDRHVDRRDDGDFEVVMFKEPRNSMASTIGVLIAIVCDASKRVHGHFATGLADKYESFEVRYAKAAEVHAALKTSRGGAPTS